MSRRQLKRLEQQVCAGTCARPWRSRARRRAARARPCAMGVWRLRHVAVALVLPHACARQHGTRIRLLMATLRATCDYAPPSCPLSPALARSLPGARGQGKPGRRRRRRGGGGGSRARAACRQERVQRLCAAWYAAFGCPCVPESSLPAASTRANTSVRIVAGCPHARRCPHARTHAKTKTRAYAYVSMRA